MVKGIVHTRDLPEAMLAFSSSGVRVSPQIDDVFLYMQTYHANPQPSARLVRETPMQPSYYDYANANGRNCRPGTHIRIDLGDSAIRAARLAFAQQGVENLQGARCTAAFEVGIPLHLLHRKEAKFFRITVTVSYKMNLGDSKVLCMSKPCDFSLSNLDFIDLDSDNARVRIAPPATIHRRIELFAPAASWLTDV